MEIRSSLLTKINPFDVYIFLSLFNAEAMTIPIITIKKTKNIIFLLVNFDFRFSPFSFFIFLSSFLSFIFCFIS